LARVGKPGDSRDLGRRSVHWPGAALEIALDAETAGYEYYKNVLETTSDPEIKALAKEFVEEESGHVAELRKWIAAHKAGQITPAD